MIAPSGILYSLKQVSSCWKASSMSPKGRYRDLHFDDRVNLNFEFARDSGQVVQIFFPRKVYKDLAPQAALRCTSTHNSLATRRHAHARVRARVLWGLTLRNTSHRTAKTRSGPGVATGKEGGGGFVKNTKKELSPAGMRDEEGPTWGNIKHDCFGWVGGEENWSWMLVWE